MLPGERFKGWIDGLSVAWGDRLGAWLVSRLAGGVELTLDDMEPELVNQARAHLEKIRDLPDLPPETRALLDGMLSPRSFAWVPALVAFLVSIIMPVFTSMSRGALEPARQQAEKLTPYHIVDIQSALGLYLRRDIDAAEFYEIVARWGYSRVVADKMMMLKRVILPSDLVLEAWLRDPGRFQSQKDELTKLGLDQPAIDLLEELAYKLPSAQEAITWLAREVFEPDMVRKYGLDDEFAGLDLTIMTQIGIKPEIALNHWRAHWQHASWSQMVAMLHRGVLRENETLGTPPASTSQRVEADAAGERAIYDWFRLVEIPPFWRNGLTATMWNVPGRVEARMLAQYGLVDKPFLVELLARDGLAAEYRDVVADMMLVRGIRADIQTRYAKKWLDSAGVRDEIDRANLAPAVAERLYQWIVSNAQPERTAPERDLTAAEIVKGVKRGVIDWSDGIERLMALGYDEAEADFRMAIDVEVVADAPSTALNIKVDTIRRRRRQRLIDRAVEIGLLLALNIDPDLANAYADNDDLRLVRAPAGETS